MSIEVTPIDATLGAVVTGVDLARLDDDTWEEIHEAFLTYGLLVFPGQHNLDDESQGAFALRFGKTEQLSPKQASPIARFSNQKADGTLARPGQQQYQMLKGNEGWHTDSTYMALVVPPEGGETEFADMRAAYDELDDATKERLEGLSAYHSLYRSQSRLGYTHTTDNQYGFHDKGAPLRPVIKTHPETGRKSLYTGRHAYGIPGMSEEESESLLAKLLDDACQPPRTYRHSWTVGDLVIWDNRCVMHRARPYDPNHTRILRASRISGEPESELAPTFADPRAEAFHPSSTNESSLNQPREAASVE